MSSFRNDGALEQGDGEKPYGHYTSTSRQQNAPVSGNPFGGGPHWSRPESCVTTGSVPLLNPWTNTTFPDHPFPANLYGGSVWQGNQCFDNAHLGPSLNIPCGYADGPRADFFTAREIAAPVSEQAFPAVQTALPTSPPHPPLPTWTHSPGSLWQLPPAWDHPVRTATQHGGHGSSVGSLGIGPEIPHVQLTPSSVVTGHSERGVMSTGRLHSMHASHSVRLFAPSDPVSVTPFTSPPRGERWDLEVNETTFQCLWTSSERRCTAVIAGDRRSVTSHLREEHDFACDGQTIACAWGSCTACMQRRNIPRHIVACHFEIKVTCTQCGLALSRADANKKHQLACTGGAKAPALGGSEKDNGRLFF